MTTATLQQAGHRLRVLREAQKLTGREMVAKSRKALTSQQISRIENGQIDKPPMRDLVLYGRLLGLTPNQVASIYGLWDEEAFDEPPQITRIRHLFKVLPARARSLFAHDLDWVITRATNDVAP